MTSVCLTFDFDALAIWLSTFKQTTPTPLSRGEFGARVGLERILALLSTQRVPATFFVPAHTARSFPDAVARIVDLGHEVASHGYIHETPVGLSREQEAELLGRSEEILTQVAGTRPRGYRSPAWDLSPHTIELLEQRSYLYDSSLMADDFRPFRPRKNDRLTEEGLTMGPESSLIEFPVAWELDDYPYFHFASRPFNQGLRNSAEVLSLWAAEFDYCHTELAAGVFTLTLHPEIIGRGPRIRLLDQLIAHMRQAPGVEFLTMSAQATRLREEPPAR
jgi:peptidoglycan-N-acetylglucosamine deacetylase